MQDAPLAISDLRLRAGWGLQGNPAVPPYASLITLEPTTGATYVFGETPVTGIAPVRNPNPNLRWEETSQINLALDYGFLENRFTGSVEYYVKNTEDLLLTVPVPQPALVPDRLVVFTDRQQHAVPVHHLALVREVEVGEGDVLLGDVLPDVHLRPVR